MKKSFMTRALATGLSLAMAFSLSAATNVTVASAASTPTMASKQFAVRVGGATKTYKASAATLKKFRITKATVGNSSKATVAVASSKKGIKVTPGTVTGSTVVKVTFKNSKTKKSTAKKFRCVVKAEEKKELTMTAEATGVKKITVKFNQAVDTATALTVAKGSATTSLAANDAIVWSTDATEATLTTAGKLTEGTYTVSAKVAEDKTLTADVVVAKNETLTSFALVGETLKAKNATETTTASIEYQALNQYGEPMSCSSATVTIAPGTQGTNKTPTATKNGVATVTDIPTMYTTPSFSEFSVVIVDSATGVNFNGKVKYGACAKAASVETVGLYNTKRGKIQDMTAGENVGDYQALFTVKDQYGDPYTVKQADVSGDNHPLTATAASGLTNVKVADFAAADPIVTVDEKDYFAIPLTNLDNNKKAAVAGDFSIMIVNSQIGQVGSPSFTVSDSVLIQSIDISADAVYAGQENTLNYTVTDTKGNTVTAYKDLSSVKFGATDKENGSLKGTMKFVKNADGTAKLVYEPKTFGANSPLKSNIEIFTVTANEVTSSNYLVKTVSFTVLADRKASAVVGVSSSTATSTSQAGKELTIKLCDLLIEDQYGSLFTADELKKANGLVSGASIWITGAGITSSPAGDGWSISQGSLESTGVAFKQDVKFKAPTFATSAAITSYSVFVDGKPGDAYTLKMAKVADNALGNISNLKIESINKGYPVYVTTGAVNAVVTDAAFNVANSGVRTIPVVITGTVNGRKVLVDASQCDLTLKLPEDMDPSKGVKNEKGTVTVLVSTADGPETLTAEFDVSNAAPALKLIEKDDDYKAADHKVTGASNAAVNSITTGAAVAAKGFKAKDQYGNDITDLATRTDIVYGITFKSLDSSSDTELQKYANKEDAMIVKNNDMASAVVTLNNSVEAKPITLTVTVAAKYGTTVVEYDIILEQTAS